MDRYLSEMDRSLYRGLSEIDRYLHYLIAFWNQCLAASTSVQECLGASMSVQECLGAPRSVQKCLGASRTVQKAGRLGCSETHEGRTFRVCKRVVKTYQGRTFRVIKKVVRNIILELL